MEIGQIFGAFWSVLSGSYNWIKTTQNKSKTKKLFCFMFVFYLFWICFALFFFSCKSRFIRERGTRCTVCVIFSKHLLTPHGGEAPRWSVASRPLGRREIVFKDLVGGDITVTFALKQPYDWSVILDSSFSSNFPMEQHVFESRASLSRHLVAEVS